MGGFFKVVLSRLSREKILSQSADNFRRGRSFSVSLFLGTDKVKIRGGGTSRFSDETFLSHSAENVCRGTLLHCVSENFRKPKKLWISRWEYQDIPSNIFLSHSAEIFLRGIL